MGIRYQRAVDLVELTGILQTTVSGLSIDEIAQRFEVSRRTAERMLSALRERFPDLEPVFRGSRKYWKLPPTSRARPIQLPKTLQALSERIVQLEAQMAELRCTNESLRGITEGVLGTSPVGLVLLDPELRIVWANAAFCHYLDLSDRDWTGCEMRALVQERIKPIMADPDRFAERVLASYDDDAPSESFECRVVGRPGCEERRLEHWSHPISAGCYAGGRIDHYADVTGWSRRARGEGDPLAAAGKTPTGSTAVPASVTPALRSYLATLQEAAGLALKGSQEAPALRSRLVQVVQSTTETIGSVLDVLEHGQSKVEPLSVPVALQTVYSLIRSAAEEGRIQLAIVTDTSMPPIAADRALVVSSLAGAARNSIASLPPGSRIELRAELLQEPERVRISILDDGPGMPEAIPELDGPFIPTRSGGIGLGVTLMRDAAGRPQGIAQYFDALTWTGDPGPDA